MILGIFGNIAAGKSTLAQKKQRQEAEKNWEILDLDEIGHMLLQKPTVQKKIQQTFPELQNLQKIDRQKLRNRVFTDLQKLKTLESILHPWIQKEMKRFVQKAQEENKNLLLLSALPHVFSLTKICDEVIWLPISKEEAWRRVQKDRPLTREMFENIWERQNKLQAPQ